jgi:3-deoxy-D-arabino-heptulosonate 7-phosphate (DAHP) synthase
MMALSLYPEASYEAVFSAVVRAPLTAIILVFELTGDYELVLPLIRAAIAVGADGVIVDVHPSPETALCDGPQALIDTDMKDLRETMARFGLASGRRLTFDAPDTDTSGG